jgi:hypothetical protein
MTNTKLTTVDILAVKCDVWVSPRGHFYVYLEGRGEADDYNGREALASAGDFDTAVEKTKPQIRKRKVKVAVPFKRVRGFGGGGTPVWRWEDGVASGFHSSTGNVLTTINGASEQITGRDSARSLYRGDMPQDVQDEYLRLRVEVQERQRQITAIDRKWGLDDIAKEVTAAIEATAEAAA